ncbi:MAG: sulfatase [bacterium]|nr:sulfatase [bacterium]
MKRTFWRLIRSLFAVGLLWAAILLGGGCEKAAEPAPSEPLYDGPMPNIVFIVIDTLRADSLGIYGNPRGSTPELDAIAAEGIVFERAIAASPWTQPSMASLFCSTYPGVHQVLDYRQAFQATFGDAPKVAVFNESFHTLAESLQARGYATAGFVANPYLLAEFGFAQGFDHYDTSFAKNTTPGGVVNQAALAWLQESDPDQPFFLYLHYMDAHGPYTTGGDFLEPLLIEVEALADKTLLTAEDLKQLGYLRKPPKGATDIKRHTALFAYQEYWSARYEAGVRQTDRYIGELRTGLSEQSLWDDTYVIITADHGEALCEHGWWEHGWSAHHTDLHVPLILRHPGTLPANTRLPQTARLIDVMPTLLDQLELPEPEGMQGRSLSPTIAGRPPTQPTIAFAEGVKIGAEQKAAYVGDWKLLITYPTDNSPPYGKLYQIGEDPLEKQDLFSRQQQQAQALSGLLQTQVKENSRRAAGIDVQHRTLTPAQIERLRALGYLGTESESDED